MSRRFPFIASCRRVSVLGLAVAVNLYRGESAVVGLPCSKPRPERVLPGIGTIQKRVLGHDGGPFCGARFKALLEAWA